MGLVVSIKNVRLSKLLWYLEVWKPPWYSFHVCFFYIFEIQSLTFKTLMLHTLDVCSQIYWTKCNPRWLKFLVGGNAESVLSTASTLQLFADTLKQSTWQILWTVVKSVGNFAQRQMHSNVIKRLIFWKIIKMIMKWKWIKSFLLWIMWIKYCPFYSFSCRGDWCKNAERNDWNWDTLEVSGLSIHNQVQTSSVPACRIKAHIFLQDIIASFVQSFAPQEML